MKKLILVTLVLCLSFSLFAQEPAMPRIFDGAGLLNERAITELEAAAQAIADAYNFDLVIVTTEETGGYDLFDYADALLAVIAGEGRDGGILLQVTGERDYVISASGRGIRILNSYAMNKLETDVLQHLRNNNYAEAYRTFFNTWEEFLILESRGRSYSFVERWNVVLMIVAWVIAVAVGLVVVGGWKRKMNTALPKTEADAFIVPGSLSFTKQQDNFLNSIVTKVRRSSESSSSGGGGGTRSISGGRGSSRGKY